MKRQPQHESTQPAPYLYASRERLDWISKYLELADKMFQPHVATTAKLQSKA